MIGVDTSEPNTPPFVIVNVPPVRSSIVSLPSRARLATAEMSRAISSMPLRSASLMFGHDEPGVGRDRDAHVHIVLVDDRVAVDLRVDVGIRLERQARRLHEEGHERELDAVLLLDALLEPLAQRARRRSCRSR